MGDAVFGGELVEPRELDGDRFDIRECLRRYEGDAVGAQGGGGLDRHDLTPRSPNKKHRIRRATACNRAKLLGNGSNA